MVHILANPKRFLQLSARIVPIALVLAVVLGAVGLYGGLVLAPKDYLQGEAMRIMYVHVPAAWMAMFIYAALGAASASYLIWKHPVADCLARGASPVGAAFTAVALVTGMIWGIPSWGVAWVWDARLTSVLVLLFLYMGHIVLLHSIQDSEQASKFAAILALLGLVNLPIIKWSVDWWNTLHQPASISSLERLRDPSIDGAMLWPLLVMGAAFMFWVMALLLLAARREIAHRRLRVQWLRGGRG
jgi:heme exporter protein C